MPKRTKSKAKVFYVGRNTHSWLENKSPMYVLSSHPLKWNAKGGRWEEQSIRSKSARRIFSAYNWMRYEGLYLKPGASRKIKIYCEWEDQE